MYSLHYQLILISPDHPWGNWDSLYVASSHTSDVCMSKPRYRCFKCPRGYNMNIYKQFQSRSSDLTGNLPDGTKRALFFQHSFKFLIMARALFERAGAQLCFPNHTASRGENNNKDCPVLTRCTERCGTNQHTCCTEATVTT